MISRVVVISLLFFITSCATVPVTQTSWKTSPAINTAYEKGWSTLVSVVSDFSELETLEPQSGYLKSNWKTTDTCWAGIAYGGSVPCKKERVIAKIESRNPFVVKINVEVETKDMTATWFYVDKWVSNGSNVQIENKIMEAFLSRIK